MSTLIEVDPATSDRLDNLARELQVTKAHVLCQAIEALEYELEFKKDVEVGLKELDEGKFIPDEEVEAYFASKRASLRKPLENENSLVPSSKAKTWRDI